MITRDKHSCVYEAASLHQLLDGRWRQREECVWPGCAAVRFVTLAPPPAERTREHE